jgi:hypothetical protein
MIWGAQIKIDQNGTFDQNYLEHPNLAFPENQHGSSNINEDHASAQDSSSTTSSWRLYETIYHPCIARTQCV